ncbi:MAG: hypothetical protein QM504_19150 [Pseudomonadota bacterium]
MLILRLSIKQRVMMVTISCVLLIMSFVFGYYLAEYILYKSLDGEISLLQANHQLKKEHKLLQKEKFMLESDLMIERKTYELLKQQLTEYISKITFLKKELAFYQGIVNDSTTELGVFFQNILITPANNAESELLNKQKDYQLYNYYKFSITLAKKIKRKTYRKGKIQFIFYDHAGEQVKKWKLLDVKGKVIKKLKTRFQYFNKLEGFLLIKQQPESDIENQKVTKIKISFIDSRRGDVGVSQEFDWTMDKDINYVGQ